ncbi:hypothetical protein B0H11DRAFT_1933097 [Mycena galericulata]|nr:hypothetical protein B0H11DRAFT_1933097 [Mycena galericulata]
MPRRLDFPPPPPGSPHASGSSRSRSESPGLFQMESVSVHGPALPSDHEDQIYDDFSGELAFNRPKVEDDSDSDSDEDSYQQPSCGPVLHSDQEESDQSPILYPSHPSSDPPNDFPESDGLFMNHDQRFDQTQELFAPGNALQLTDDDDWRERKDDRTSGLMSPPPSSSATSPSESSSLVEVSPSVAVWREPAFTTPARQPVPRVHARTMGVAEDSGHLIVTSAYLRVDGSKSVLTATTTTSAWVFAGIVQSLPQNDEKLILFGHQDVGSWAAVGVDENLAPGNWIWVQAITPDDPRVQQCAHFCGALGLKDFLDAARLVLETKLIDLLLRGQQQCDS